MSERSMEEERGREGERGRETGRCRDGGRDIATYLCRAVARATRTNWQEKDGTNVRYVRGYDEDGVAPHYD